MIPDHLLKHITKGVKYIGRTTDFRGNTLWEIVGNLRDYGIGRLLIRNMFQRYPEPCYMRILNVEVVPHERKSNIDEDLDRKVRVTVEKTWRGVTLAKAVTIYSSSYKADYALVPKAEEEKYLNNTQKVAEKIISDKIDFPPLLREFIKQETGEKQPTMKVHLKQNSNKFVRIAKDGVKPTCELNMGLGIPASEKLYEGVL